MTKSSKLILTNESKLLQEEKERLRKLRIIQVREISKQQAAQVRTSFQQEKNKEIKKLLQKHKSAHDEERQEGLKQIQHLVESHVQNIGQGHQTASVYDDKSAERTRNHLENKEIAALRGRVALENHRVEKNEQENKENAHIISRQFALEQEKIRSSYIAKLPPVYNELNETEMKKIEKCKKNAKMVSYHDANAFTTTRYHMPDTCVDRQSFDTVDARTGAIQEESRLNGIETDYARMNQERMEKARLRGKHALEKEILNDNYNEILTELNVLEKADREKRQKELMNIPKEIFMPAWQRQQEKNEVQLELERAFEKIYADSNLRTENEIPKPVDLKQLEISQSNFGDADLDLTLVDDTLNKSNKLPNDLNKSELQPQVVDPNKTADTTVVSQPTNVSTKSENAALSKLLDKIRKQREETSFKPTAAKVKETEKLVEKIADITVESEMWSTPNSSMKINDEPEKSFKNDSIVSNDSFKSSTDETMSENPVKNDDFLKAKQIRGIMMSSHNVSSLNDIETNRLTNNQRRKAVITKNIRNNNDDNDQITVPNTATYSIDLSHASRDQMIAGPKELFNNNDAKLAIERKRKQLESQQKELEQRLKDLEQKEAELKQSQEIMKPIAVNTKKANTNGSTNGMDSGNDHNYCSDSVDNSTLTSPTTSRRALTSEDLKRVEYQQMILKSASEKQMSKLIYAKSDETSSECSNTTTTASTNRIEERKKEILKRFGLNQVLLNKKPPQAPVSIVNSDDKNTMSSADSGFSSLSNNIKLKKQQINLEVEHLNNEILKHKQQQNDDDLLAYLSTSNIDRDELLRRLSTGSSSSLLSSENISARLNEQQLTNLFGLEFFESPNIRDLSVEKLIGWKLNQQQELYQTQNDVTLTSSNDTLNDGDDVNESDDSNSLVVSLLNSRNMNHLNEQQTVDLKRQFIQEQLEIVRKRKEQLQSQQRSVQMKSNHKSGSDLNLHELSTIKEVDTPISERNLKLNSNKQLNSNNNNNKSGFMNMNDMSTTIGLSMLESSLENVTQLSENNNNLTQFHHSFKSIKENSILSDSNKSLDNTFTSNSTSTPMTTNLQVSNQLLSINSMRQKQMQLFDASLFEYSPSNNSSPTKLSNTNMKLTEYGAMIYDELSTNNLSSFQTTGLASAVSFNTTNNQSKSAFKTESTGSLDMKQKIFNHKPDINKKWFDILATSVDSDDNKTLDSSNSLIQQPISNSTSSQSFFNNNSISITNSMIQISEASSHTSLKQYTIDSSETSAKLERTLNQYKSPTRKLNETGLFDRFIKNYSATSSVQDEPELSFVSYKTVSNPVSPSKKSTLYNTEQYSTSKLSNVSSNDSSLSLIQFQQKQLSKQFANLSPIELNQNRSNKMAKSMSTVDFTLFESKTKQYEDDSHEMTSSIILFSPEKDDSNCDKSNPFIKFNEDDYSLLSTNEIESAMTAATTSFNAKPKRKSSKAHLSSLEPIKDLSTDDINSNCSQSLISFEQHELTQCTPMSDQFKTQSNSTPMSRLNDFSNATNEFKNYFNSLQSTSVINDESELTMLADQ